uniref:Uncharacterized protein n=2 Tax=Varanus komodoensis TaxID=61221 RepID=A0A8D2LW84_VARKO
MGAMAAQVGAAAALASLTSIAGLQKGTSVLHHTLVGSLSDTSLKSAEHPSALSPPVLEKSSKFGSPVRPATVPPAATGPRLTPKPFSRETSSDTFAGVKPPVTALKPSSVAPKSPTFAKTFGDATTPKGLTGNIPPLVDQKSIENRSTKDFVANMPFYSSPLANTVILFNTGNTEKAGMKLAAERTFSTLQAQEGPVPSAVSEPPFRRPESAGIQRQLSLSSEPRSLSWNLHRSLEMKDTFSGATEERAKNVEKDLRNSSINLVGEVQPRPKQRPVSAIFLESVKDPKQSTPDIPDEKSLPEKSWVRKPRPLSVDLTAKFENRDLSAQRKSCPPESKERPLTAHLADTLGSRPSEMGAKSEAAESSTADAPRSYLKSTVPVANSQSAKSDAATHIQTPSPNEAAPLGWNTPKDTGQVSAKDRKFLWEQRLKGQDEDNDAEADSAGVSEKSKGLPDSKGWCVKEKAALSQRDTCTVSKDAASTSDPENKFSRGGSVKKPLNFLGTLTNGVASGNADSRPESPGKEKKSMNIQQRIKELTTENTDGKPANRRSYASRPLSADLTKLFSSPVTAAEMKSEKKPELNRMLLSDMQEVQENEPQLLRGADSSETRAAGSPQKPQQLSRAARAGGPLEKEGSLLKGREPVAPQGESPASVASHDAKVYSTPPTAEKAAGIKTVRATLFEHSVQRHSVSVSLSGTELTSQPWKETVGRPLGHRKELWPEGESDAQATSKKVPFRQGDLSPDADKPWKRDSSNEEKALKAAATCEKFTAKGKYEKHTSKQIEDSLMYQRIEPRYEILQTVGDRVQSEAVTAVPENEAMPLRSRRSLRRRTEGSATDAAWARSLDSKSGNRAKDGFVPEPKAAGETAGKTAFLEELYGSSSPHAFLRQVPKLDQPQTGQQQAPVKAPYLQSRNKNSETVDDKGSKQPSEAEREKREAVLAGKLDSSRILKHFPENLGVAPGRTDGCEAGVSTGQDAAASVASEPESRPSPCGASQWHKFSNRTSPPGADPARTYEQEGAKAFGLKTFPATYVAHEELTASDRRAEGDQLQRPDAEGWGRRSGRALSGTKASERWRRK